MADAQDVRARLGRAVHQNSAGSRTGMQERVFASLFQGLVYPQIWEDPVVDMHALSLGPADDVICIGSGGCNMMSYLSAEPNSITVVDLSPAHVALNRLKLAAVQRLDQPAFFTFFGRADRAVNAVSYDRIRADLDAATRAYWDGGRLTRRADRFTKGFYRYGALGRTLNFAHRLARLGGVDFRPLFRCPSMADQTAYFEREIAPLFDMWIVRKLAQSRASLFGLGIPPAQYEKLAADQDGDILPVLKERVRKLMCDFPISQNYFAWQAFARHYDPGDTPSVPPYLEPAHFEAVRRAAPRVTVLNRMLTSVLADAEAGSKSAYVFLDAQDWMTDAQLNALWSEVTRTARPGARVIFRTGGSADILPGRVHADILSRWSYDAPMSQEGLRKDRSAIYGGFHLYRKTA